MTSPLPAEQQPSPPQRAELICIGTELLLGDILNSNAQYLAQELAALGIPHFYQTVVGDNPERIQQVVRAAAARSQLLLFTGGLGPTPDDLTTETLAACFGAPLIEQPDVLAAIKARFEQRGWPMPPSNAKQALLPQGANLLPNPVGSAPGMIWEPQPNLILMTFPGVPREMKAMWQTTARPYLQARGWVTATIASRMLRFWGISESALAEQVTDFFDQANPTVAPYASRGEVRLRISAKAPTLEAAEALIAPTAAAIRAQVGHDYFGSDDATLASAVGELLSQHQHTLAVAESCTGGGLGSLLTQTPGSSAYFLGGVIAYSNQVKVKQLGVEPATLDQHGAVSAETACQMALGVRQQLGADWGLSITGIAGPDGGTAEKPVGLVYIGLADPKGNATSIRHQFGASRGREWVRHVSAQSALDSLRRQLLILGD